LPTEIEISFWERYPDAGVCVATGYNGLVAIDIDTDDSQLMAAILSALPLSHVAKRGAKGRTLFYRHDGTLESSCFDVGGARVVDVLGHGRQTILPPTIHPATTQPYHWLTSETLLNRPIEQLPMITKRHVQALAQALDPFGYIEAKTQAFRWAAGDSYWQDLKVLALENLDYWVPTLGLSKTAKVSANNWRAVADWRGGENLNVSFHRDGIRDFVTGESFSPIDIVMRARGLQLSAATRWLADRLNFSPNKADSFEVAAFVLRAQQRRKLHSNSALRSD
jgi:hypothetical protein